MMELFRRLRYLFHRRRFDQELVGEMEFHREMAARAGGGTFGNTLRLREEAREAWGWMWLDHLLRDSRYALRRLRHSPGFTMAAVLMLSLGVGVNVATFSFFDLMVLRPMNVKDPSTLLRFHRRGVEKFAYSLPYPEMAFFRENSRTLSSVLGLNFTKLNLEGEGKPVNAGFVTANFFTELGAGTTLGRGFEAVRDGSSDAEPRVILSYGLWQRHFASDPEIVGKVVRFNGKAATVVGVASRAFNGLNLAPTDLWAPIGLQPYFVANSHLLSDFSLESPGVVMWGRLQPGVTPKIAEEELRSLAAQLHTGHPKDIWEKEGLPSEPGAYAKSLMIVGRRGTGPEGNDELYPVFLLLGTLCLLILVVSCSNLGSLLLARGVAREREISICVAIGAGRGRLLRQLFTESLLLGQMGAVMGVALGYLVLRVLLAATGVPEWVNPAPDWRVALFAAGMGLLAAVLFGLVPAWRAARQRQRSTLLRRWLIATQVAGSCVLVILAGLLLRALDHATSADPGFGYQQVIAIDLGLGKHGYSVPKAQAFLQSFENRLRALPGVESVALTMTPPLGNGVIGAGFDIDGHHVNFQIHPVDSEFLNTMKIPLLRGRSLLRGEQHAVVVSESMGRKAWPGQDPLGHKLTIDGEHTVVGVAGNARLTKLQDSDSAEVYLPVEENDLPGAFVLLRTSSSPERMVQPAISIARSLDAAIFPEVETMKASFQRKLKDAEYSALSLSILGSVALLLACVGIVGLVSFEVSQRTREIGLRMALGAKPSQVVASVLRQLTVPVAAGLAGGVSGAAALSQLMRQQLYGISHLDPSAYIGAVGVFIVAVALGVLLPARRALKIDPMTALRYD